MALIAGCLIYFVYHSERTALTRNWLDRTRAIAMAVDYELASLGTRHMSGVLAAQKLPASWRAAIIDDHALVVARTHEAALFVGKPVKPDLRARMLRAPEGAYETLTLDAIPVLTVYSHAPASHWTVAVGIPLAELTESLYGGIAWLAVCTTVAAALGLLLALTIASRIAGSVTALIGPAAAIGGNAPIALPHPYFAEARILGDALADAHQKLGASEQRLDLATQATGIGIWMRDARQNILWASDAWRTLFGFGPTEVFGMDDVIARIHPDDRVAVRAALLGVTRPGDGYDIEYRLVMDDGSLRWVVSRGRVSAADPDHGTVVLGISSDVSPRKLAELALQKKQEQVIHLSRVSVIGALSGALAHEINQPLTSILSNAQAAQRLIERSPPPLDDIREILADIVAEDQRAAEVIRRLRGLLRNSAPDREAIDFAIVAGEVASLLRNDLLNRDIRVDVQVAPDLPRVAGDRVQLQQVLINLIVNGCDAIGVRDRNNTAPRHIVVAATPAPDDTGVDLTVHDSGPGLQAGEYETVFEPFHSSKPDGMGLGLAICRKIIAAHGGRIRAFNHPAGGAVFHVSLPGAHD